ncbi:hypothetical protein G6F43_003446 [Rhizopus delemar]|nr:hypothetical protein G6F43_003446 [Rhizopus delemar]
MKFRCTIYTDGIGVSILKQNYDTKKEGGISGEKRRPIEADEFQYIEKLGKEDCWLVLGNPSFSYRISNLQIVNKEKFVEYLQERVKEGFLVYLLDEFRISSLCPSYQNGELETFKKVQKPRPYQREKYPIADRHGHLRCKNQQCLKVVTSTIEATAKVPLRRLWNCDIAATLNFRHILFSLRANSERPERFCRSKKSLSTCSKRENMSSSSASTSQPTKRPNNPL